MSQKNTLGLKLVAGIKDYTKIKVYSVISADKQAVLVYLAADQS